MPVEIRELTIKATLALDCDNQTIKENDENIVCLRLPDNEKISKYVEQYFKQNKSRSIEFDQSKLSAFLAEWQASLLK